MVAVLRADGTIEDVKDDSDQRFMLVLDEVGDIVRGNKNSLTWLGKKPQQLADMNIADILAPQSQLLITDIIVNTNSGFILKEQPVFVYGAARLVKGFMLRGEPVETEDDDVTHEYRLHFKFDAELTEASSNMNTPKGFANSVTDILKHSEQELDMTFVSIGDVDGMASSLSMSDGDVENFTNDVESRLRESSLDQAALGRVSSGKYGVLHQTGTDLGDMCQDIEQLANKVDPDGKALNVKTKTLALDSDGLADEEMAEALSHAIDSFAANEIDDLIFDNLSSAHTAFLDHKSNRLQILQEALDKDKLTLVYQPVVNVHKWYTDHLWAEFRADLDDDGLGVDEIIKFTRDNIDMRTQVDIAQCNFLEGDNWHKGVPIALTIHVRSLLNETVLARLLQFAASSNEKDVILRISGFKAEDIDRLTALTTLHDAGFGVALHGEELGAINAELLEKLPADFIVLDDGFTESPERLKASINMLEVMEKRCMVHNIKLIFDGILVEETALQLGKLQLAVATGAYFGDHVENLEELRYPIQEQ